jgi:hypothetical protein
MDKEVQLFNKIREIPYHISINGESGSDCEDKAKMLKHELERLGHKTRIRVSLFRWSEQSWLSKDVAQIKHDDECSHMFIDLLNKNGTWIHLDPTWNSALAAAGMEISEWDGENETILGLNCYKILNPKDSLSYIGGIDYEGDIKRNGDFYRAFNKYCDKFLEKGSK